MKIKIKINGKKTSCEVRDEACRNRSCFSPHKFIHQNKTIDGTTATYQDEFYSCSHRNYHGCPLWSNKR